MDNGKAKILTLVGTRPEIIKLSRVIQELDKHTNHILVHSGQNYDYELNEIFFKELQLRKPDYFLNAAGETAAETIGRVIVELDKVLAEEKPEAFLIYGDTNSCLGAIAAKRRHIPVFHMEAGNRSFDQRVPEELNRKIIDHISDINMTLTEHARRYLEKEGLRGDRIIKTGSSMFEVIHHHREAIDKSGVLQELKLEPGRYFVASLHREENVDNTASLDKLVDILNSVVSKYGHPIVFSVHPRTRKRLEARPQSKLNEKIKIMKPLGFLDYCKLQTQAFCVLSDSGTITEEASILGFPAVTLRENFERPEGMDEGTLILTGLDKTRVLQSIDIVTRDKKPARLIPDYNVDGVAAKVVRIIISHIDQINRNVWFKF